MNDELEITKLRALLRKALTTLRELQPSGARAEEEDGVAAIGMACELPGGVETPEAYWELLLSGVACVRDAPASAWVKRLFDEYERAHPEVQPYTRAHYLARDPMRFDPRFFNISPREARDMDPSQRLALRLTWEAFERAGYDPRRIDGRVGVYFGVIGGEYGAIARRQAELGDYVATGTLNSVLSGRIAHAFDFTGPAISVDTACSSSLVAFHLACEGIRHGDCDVAVVGGVNLLLDPSVFRALAGMSALSRDGLCKPFSGVGEGYGRGEGGGVVLLKRRSLARRDGDAILAVVRATAINHDGTCSGLTVPNGAAQRRLLEAAVARAAVSPAEIDYLETHGTGTRLGDPIELAAVADVYGRGRDVDKPLTLGAAKAQIGHLEAASGIAGILKLLLCIQHRMIPAQPAPGAPPRDSSCPAPLRIPKEHERVGESFTCAVSSFGFSGTNAHAILSAPPRAAPAPRHADGGRRALLVSAKSRGALAKKCDQMLAHLEANDRLDVDDVCFTSAVGRDHGPYRTFVVGRSRDEIVAALRAHNAARPCVGAPRLRGGGAVRVAVFGGEAGGAASFDAAMYARYEAFRAAFDEVDAASRAHGGAALAGAWSSDGPALRLARLHAHAALWRSLGVVPSVWFGGGVGLYAAAIASGALTVDAATRALLSAAGGADAESGAPHDAHAIAVVSPIDGAFASAAQLEDVAYLARAAAAPVDVARGAAACEENDVRVALSLLPGDGARAATDGVEWIVVDADAPPEDALLDAALRLHELGVDVDWRAFHAPRPARRVLLPTYPFEEEAYAFPLPPPRPAASSPGARARGDDPLAPRVEATNDAHVALRFAIGEASLPELRDTHHVVHVGLFVEMLLRGIAASIGGAWDVRDMRFVSALIVRGDEPPAPRDVRLTIERAGPTPRFAFASRRAPEDAWETHVEGSLAPRRAIEPPPAVAVAGAPTMSADAFYRGMARRGLRLGPSVRVVGDVRVDGATLHADVALGACAADPERPIAGLAPAILDGCAQAFHAMMPPGVPEDAAFMVESLEQLSFAAEATGAAARITLDGVRLDGPRSVRGSFVVVDGGIEAVLSAHAPLDARSSLRADEVAAIREATAARAPALLEAALRRLFAAMTGTRAEEIGATARTSELGFDSLLALRLHKAIAPLDPNGRVPLATIVGGTSIAELARALVPGPTSPPPAAAPRAARRFVKARSASARLRLLCFPYGGGSSLLFQGWSALFGAEVDVCAIELPGRGERLNEPLVADVHALAARIEEELLGDSEVPFAMYGHSAGALLAYVLATRLRARGCAALRHLYVGAFSSPAAGPNPFHDEATTRMRALGLSELPDATRIAAMSDADVRRLAEALRVPGLAEKDATFVRLMLPILTNDIRLVGSFAGTAPTPIDVPITAFFGARDDRVTEDEMRAWERLTTARFRFHALDGDHFFLHPDQRRGELVARIAASEREGT